LTGFLRWLWPGIGVKRWVGLFGLGIVLVSLGLAVMVGGGALRGLGDWVRDVAYLLTGSFLTPGWRGLLLVVPGLAIMAFAAGGLVRAVLTVLFPDTGHVGELISQRKYLERGPRVVAIGGGTGLSALLRGLKMYTSNITAIVTVTDDGGSSGRLRGELGVPPPGDIRNCLVALADTEPLMERLFQHRFGKGRSLSGHTFGNLFIAAMAEVTGDFELAVRESSRVLAVRGLVLPSTRADVTLEGEFEDGQRLRGESAITGAGRAVRRVYLDPAAPEPLPESLQAIASADLIVLGPGSLYTSVIPNLLVKGIPEAIVASPALVAYVSNIMTEHGETDGYSVVRHVQAIFAHAGQQLIDVVVENEAAVAETVLESYAREQAFAVPSSRGEVERMGLRAVRGAFLEPGPLARHDPFSLARALMRLVAADGGRSARGRVGLYGFMWLAERLRGRATRRAARRAVRDRKEEQI
jgi:uncharacterized cofD-like protein